MRSVEEIESAGLACVNDLRFTYRIGKPLAAWPKGKRNSAMKCPVAIATCAMLADEEVLSGGPFTSGIKTPTRIREFMHAFDAGAMRHLVAK